MTEHNTAHQVYNNNNKIRLQHTNRASNTTIPYQLQHPEGTMHQPRPHSFQSHRRTLCAHHKQQHQSTSIEQTKNENKMVTTKKEKNSTMHKQYTLYNSEVHKKAIKMGSKKMQVQEKGRMAEYTWQKYLYLTNSIVPSSMDTRRFHYSLSQKTKIVRSSPHNTQKRFKATKNLECTLSAPTPAS